MNTKDDHIIAVSYAKRALVAGSREQKRMERYAAVVGSLTLIVFTRRSDGLPDRFEQDNLTIIGTQSRTKLGMLLWAIKLGRAIAAEATGKNWIVSSQDPFVAGFVSRAIARPEHLPVQVQMHGFAADLKAPWYYPLRAIRAWYGRRVLRKACAIRVVSERIRRTLGALGFDRDAITVLPIQPELTTFLQVDGSARATHTTCTFIYVGRLSSEKHVSLIVRAFAIMHAANSATRLRIVGDGSERSTLEAQCQALGVAGAVTFVGWTDAVAAEYAAADVALLASDHEGYAMVLLEALAAGLPVVTTDVGCAGEVVHNAEHGYIVPVGDSDVFAQRMQQLAADRGLRERMGEAGRVTATALQTTDEDYAAAWAASVHCTTGLV